MALSDDVSRLESNLNSQSTRLDNLASSARQTVDSDLTQILACLRQGVDAIRSTMEVLDNLHPSDDDSNDDSVDGFASMLPVALESQRTAMAGSFGGLAEAAQTALKHVSQIRLSVADLEGAIDQLKHEVDSVTADAETAVRNAQQALEHKRSDLRSAESERDEANLEMASLDSKLDETRDDRDALRVARIFAWGLTAFFPPTALVAAGIEVGASNIRSRLRRLKSIRESAEGRHSKLVSDISSLERQRDALATAVDATRRLSDRCHSLITQVRVEQAEVINQCKEYQGLTEASDSLKLWSDNQRDRAIMIEEYADSREELMRMTKKLVEDVLECKNPALLAACSQLRYITAG